MGCFPSNISYMTGVLAVFGAVLVVGSGLAIRAALAVLRDIASNGSRTSQVLGDYLDGGAASQEARFRDLEDLVDRLPQRWEEIKREASRLDGRARYAVTSIKKELDDRGLEDAGVEGLANELQLVDAGSGGSESVPAMPEGMAQDLANADWRSVVRSQIKGA